MCRLAQAPHHLGRSQPDHCQKWQKHFHPPVKLGALSTTASGVDEKCSRGTEAAGSGRLKSAMAMLTRWMKGSLHRRVGKRHVWIHQVGMTRKLLHSS